MFNYMVVILILISIVIYYLLVHYIKRRLKQFLMGFEDETILLIHDQVNFMGQSKRGIMQLRGNGFLVLTSKRLAFQMITPKKNIIIETCLISSVEIVETYLGKFIGQYLLKINYYDQEELMSMAFSLSRIEEWMDTLQGIIQENVT